MPLPPGIAAGHPATADVGIEILTDGGTAADAAVAASLASCVAETVMTGLAGGGHAIYWDAGSGAARLLDFFVAAPGLGASAREAHLEEIHVPFGEQLVHYSVGIGSCAVPGVPAGLEELWRSHGRLPWERLVAPALRLARSSVPMPPAHAACLAMLAPVMTTWDGARIYAPGGRLLESGDPLVQPGLARALELVAEEGARTFYSGSVARALIALMDERGGRVTWDDLAAYAPTWSEPVAVDYAGVRVLTRGGFSGLPETLASLPRLSGLSPAGRALVFADELFAPEYSGDTTNITVADPEGNACVVTTSLGLGSGDFLPGLDVHLNSMLGETDLLLEELVPGARMASMMAPTVGLGRDGPVVAAGAAGGTRLRGALVQVLAGILDESLQPQAAVDRPRIHPTPEVIRVEGGFDDDAVRELESRGHVVRRWHGLHHYFGGVSAIAAGDSRQIPGEAALRRLFAERDAGVDPAKVSAARAAELGHANGRLRLEIRRPALEAANGEACGGGGM